MKLLSTPPVNDKSPMDYICEDEYRLLLEHQKAFGKLTKVEDVNKERAKWPEDALKRIGIIREKLLAFGFIVLFVGDNNRLVFGVRLKTKVQVLMEKNAEHYYQRGLELAGGDMKAYIDQVREGMYAA